MIDDTSFETHRQQETRDFILQLRRLIVEKDAEIERLKKMYAEMFCFREDLVLENMALREQIEGLKNCSDLNWIRVKTLVTRAADALEEACLERGIIGAPLIDELRKAAE